MTSELPAPEDGASAPGGLVLRVGRAIPTPWQARRYYDDGGWGHEVLSAEGKRHDYYRVSRDEGALLAAVQAVAPEALDYVLAAAAKGGTEAQRIARRFQNTLVTMNTPAEVRAVHP